MIATIKLWSPPVAEEETEGSSEVSARLTLGEYFERVHVGRLSDATASTRTIYREAIDWWRRLSGDPPIESLDQATVDAFHAALGDARFRRGKVGAWRPLSAWSRVKIERTLRAVLRQLGPDGDDLIRRVPKLRIRLPDDAAPADTWTVDQARAIVAAADHAAVPKLSDVAPRTWWRAYLAISAYTGLRRGTVLALRRRHVVQRSDGAWLAIDAASASKVKRFTQAALHRLAVAAIAELPDNGPESLLLPWPHHIRTIGDVHYRLQTSAGLAAGEQHELHGWRRWHANEMAGLGLGERLESARASLGHSSIAITQGHYLTAHLRLARSLPDLW